MAEITALEIEIKVDKSKAALNSLKKDLDNLGDAAKGAGKPVDDFTGKTDEAGDKANKFGKRLHTISSTINKFKKNIQNLIPSVFNFKTAIVSAVSALSIKKLVDFGSEIDRQKSFLKAYAEASGSTGYQIGELLKKTSELGGRTAFTESQVIAGANALLRMGSSAEEAREQLQPILSLAGATGQEFEFVADVVKKTANVFRDDFNVIAGQFAGASLTTAAATQDLSEAFRSVAVQGERVKAPLQDVVAAVASLVDSGIPAATAGVALRNALVRLTNDSGPAFVKIKTLASAIGIDFVSAIQDANGDLKDLNTVFSVVNDVISKNASGSRKLAGLYAEVFGEEASTTISLLASNTQKAGKSIDDVKAKIKSASDVQALYTNITSDLKGKIDVLSSTIQSRLLGAYEGIKPVISSAITKITEFIASFESKKIEKFFKNILNAAIEFSINFIKSIDPVLKGLQSIFEKATKVGKEVNVVLSTFGIVSEQDKLEGLNKELSELESKLDEAQKKGKDFWDRIFGYDKTIIIKNQIKDVIKEIYELEDKIKSSGSTVSSETKNNLNSLVLFLEELKKANIDAKKSTDDLIKSQKKLGESSGNASSNVSNQVLDNQNGGINGSNVKWGDVNKAISALFEASEKEKELAIIRKGQEEAYAIHRQQLQEKEKRSSLDLISQKIAEGIESIGLARELKMTSVEVSNFAGQLKSGIASSGPNASRAISINESFIASKGDPIVAITELVLSNKKIQDAIDKSFGKLFDKLDKIIDPFADIISVIIDVVDSLDKVINIFSGFDFLVKTLEEIARSIASLTSGISKAGKGVGSFITNATGASGLGGQLGDSITGIFGGTNKAQQNKINNEIKDSVRGFIDGVYAGIADETTQRLNTIQGQFDEQIRSIKKSGASKRVKNELKEATRIANAAALAANGFFEEARKMAETAARGGGASSAAYEKATIEIRNSQEKFAEKLVEPAKNIIDTQFFSEYEKQQRSISLAYQELRNKTEGMDEDLKQQTIAIINQAEAIELSTLATRRNEEANRNLSQAVKDLSQIDFNLTIMELENFGEDLEAQTKILEMNLNHERNAMILDSKEKQKIAIENAKILGDQTKVNELERQQQDRQEEINKIYDETISIRITKLNENFREAERQLRDAASQALKPIIEVIDKSKIEKGTTRLIEGVEISERAVVELEKQYKELADAAVNAEKAIKGTITAEKEKIIRDQASAAKRIEINNLIEIETEKINSLNKARNNSIDNLQKEIDSMQFDLLSKELSNIGKSIADINKKYSDFVKAARDETGTLLLTTKQALKLANNRAKEITDSITGAFDPFFNDIAVFQKKLDKFRGSLTGTPSVTLEMLQSKLSLLNSLGDEGILNEEGLKQRRDLMEEIYAGSEQLSLQQAQTDQNHLESINRLQALSSSLRDQINNLLLSDFNITTPENKLKIAEKQFQDLRDKALAAAESGADANDKSIQAFQDFADEYLIASQNVFKSGQGQIENFTKVTSTFSILENIISENAKNMKTSSDTTQVALLAIIDSLNEVSNSLEKKVKIAVDTLLDVNINFRGDNIIDVGGVPVFQTDLDIITKVNYDINLIASANGESIDLNGNIGNTNTKVNYGIDLSASVNGQSIDFTGDNGSISVDILTEESFNTSNELLRNIEESLTIKSGRNILQVAEWNRGYNRESKITLEENLPDMLVVLGDIKDLIIDSNSHLSGIKLNTSDTQANTSRILSKNGDIERYTRQTFEKTAEVRQGVSSVEYNTGDRGHVRVSQNRIHDRIEILTRNNATNPIWERINSLKRELGVGGYIEGPSHSQGGIDVNLEGGEYVIPKKVVSDFGVPFFDTLRGGGNPIPEVTETKIMPIKTSRSGGNTETLLVMVNQKLEKLTRVLEQKDMNVDVSVEGLDTFVKGEITRNNQAVKSRLNRSNLEPVAKAF